MFTDRAVELLGELLFDLLASVAQLRLEGRISLGLNLGGFFLEPLVLCLDVLNDFG